MAASIAVMGPEASSEYFNIASGSIQSTNSSLFLNVNGGDSASYKTLTFGTTAGASGLWGLEGDTIITTQGSSYGRRECIPVILKDQKRCWTFVPPSMKLNTADETHPLKLQNSTFSPVNLMEIIGRFTSKLGVMFQRA